MGNESKTLWISLGAALIAVFLLYSWSQEQRASLQRDFGTKKSVVIATKDIPEMTPIDDSMLETDTVPEKFFQPSAISNPELAIGQLAAAPIKKGEQVLDTKLLLPGKVTGLSMEVTPGRRAIPIPVDEMRGVSKLIKPGDRVDVVAAMEVAVGNSVKKEVSTILQDVIVLSTGNFIANQIPINVEEGKNGTYSIENLKTNTSFNTVTVEVLPDEAQKLVYILNTSPGSVFLTLRNPSDRQIKPLRTTGIDDVLGRGQIRQPTSMPEVLGADSALGSAPGFSPGATAVSSPNRVGLPKRSK